MFHPDRNKICLRLVLIVVFVFAASAICSAQTVIYDWSSDSKVPESFPKITRRQTVTFKITNVNDILYSYRLEVTQTPMDIDDFAHISGLFKVFTPSAAGTNAADPCAGLEDEVKGLLQQAIKEISEDPKLPVGYAASATHPNVPLKDSQKAWWSHAAAIKAAVDEMAELKRRGCPVNATLDAAFTVFVEGVKSIDAQVNSSHVFEDKHVISPGNNVSVMVVQMFDSETILTKTFTFPGTDILTLSAGAMFSSIADRTYEARKSPTSTLNVLAVDGNSRATPNIVALLNYSLGALRLDSDTAGLALSAGPVLKVGSQSDASAFGFFTGISGHLYHRFYVTPGIHFGQFADFPVGFGNGSTIPENFGELTPVKRWTARFGLAISFKTKDFSGLTPSDKPSVSSDEGGAATKPKPAASPGGDSSAINSSDALTRSVARSFLKPMSERTSPPSSREVKENSLTVQPDVVERRNSSAAARINPIVNDKPLAGSYFVSSSASRTPVIHVTSLECARGQSGDERVVLTAANSIDDHAMYFNGGRFYLVIFHARLDAIQDGLRGNIFSEPLVEKRGDDLVLSFRLLPGTKASVLERSSGLELLLLPATTN